MSNPLHTDDPVAYVAIAQLIAEYMDAVDAGDFDAVARLLAEATVTTPGGDTVTDPVRIRAMYAAIQPVPHPDGRRKTKHHLANLRVIEVGDGNYIADAYYFILAEPADADSATTIKTSGRYRQRIERDGARWVIREHQIIRDF